MPRSAAVRRAGSPFTGLGPVFMKELSDHLSSIRMLVLTLFVIVFGALPVGFALQDLRNVVVSDPYLFLRIFTVTPERVGLSFILALNFIIPLMAIGLGFDSVNSEFNRRTLSRVLSQPIYRDALLLGKFLGGLTTLAVALVALWLIVLGAGLLLLGLPPRGVEVARGVGFLIVAIAYGGVWLAVAMLFSVLFRAPATAALAALGLWLLFALFWTVMVTPLLATVIAGPAEGIFGPNVAYITTEQTLQRLSPNTLYSDTAVALLNPTTRALGPVFVSLRELSTMVNAPLPVSQSFILIWPQLTGLIAATIVIFVIAYVVFQRQEIRA